MKARVIKEWEMYGITHKVGEIMNIPLHSPGGLPMISDRDVFLLDNGFIEEMKEPLIKDEKMQQEIIDLSNRVAKLERQKAESQSHIPETSISKWC